MITAAFTGHRPGSLNGDYTLASPLWDRIRAAVHAYLSEGRVGRVISGMALGVDTVAASEALRLGIPLTAAIPFAGQDVQWCLRDQGRYRALLAGADHIEYVNPPGYAAWKLHKRNQWMVDHCDELAAVWNGTQPGGTCQCVSYALKVGKPVRRLVWEEGR